ncbi:MAG: D-alanyl-D-alanine carboxypeptidase/D-alanyl-D-alanine-endopeptidase [Vicingaceae bacterium]|nr:D-alanyl-D-alanine carboxypeptidase/D-alanyl-D-alanine-endopeptidase [Vicingaceae bacterium]
MRSLLFIIAVLLSVGGFSQTTKEVKLALKSLVADEDLKNASISFYALDVDSNKMIGGISSSRSLVPASTMKLVTTATALEILGPNKRFPTRIKYTGKIDSNCVLNGNIYIDGGGDPCLGSDRFKRQYGNFINKWATAILNLGIDSINGRVIADATIFDEQMIPATWIWADLGNYYGAGPSGLSIYENKCKVEFSSLGKGDSTEITCVYPYIPNLKFENGVKGMITHKDLSYIFGAPYQESRIVKGGIPTNKENFMVKGSVPDPAYLTAFELDMELRGLGIKLANPSTTIRRLKNDEVVISKEKKRTILTTWSPKLIDIITLTNMHSINLYAEHLMNQIGLNRYGSGDVGSGTQATTLFWKQKELDVDGFYVNDGSGLSRFNGVTAKQLVGILKYMNESKYKDLFFKSLPVSGKSGTMRNFAKGTVAHGKISAKSGTMTRVKSYAGYVTAKNKHRIAFAIIANNYNCTSFEMKKKMEKIIIKLAELEK